MRAFLMVLDDVVRFFRAIVECPTHPGTSNRGCSVCLAERIADFSW